MTPYQMVREFHIRFKHLVRHTPTPLPKPERITRLLFLYEEMMEFAQADDIVDQADALADMLYFIYGSFVNIGVDPDRLFTAVHEANMRKLWPDGEPRWRDTDGKVIKPEGWTGPEQAIAAEIDAQRHAANITLLQEIARQFAAKVEGDTAVGYNLLLNTPVIHGNGLPDDKGENQLGDWSAYVRLQARPAGQKP